MVRRTSVVNGTHSPGRNYSSVGTDGMTLWFSLQLPDPNQLLPPESQGLPPSGLRCSELESSGIINRLQTRTREPLSRLSLRRDSLYRDTFHFDSLHTTRAASLPPGGPRLSTVIISCLYPCGKRLSTDKRSTTSIRQQADNRFQCSRLPLFRILPGYHRGWILIIHPEHIEEL